MQIRSDQISPNIDRVRCIKKAASHQTTPLYTSVTFQNKVTLSDFGLFFLYFLNILRIHIHLTPVCGSVSSVIVDPVLGNVPLNQMQPTSRLNNAAHLTRLERKRSLLKLLLHIAMAKVPEITTLARR